MKETDHSEDKTVLEKVPSTHLQQSTKEADVLIKATQKV